MDMDHSCRVEQGAAGQLRPAGGQGQAGSVRQCSYAMAAAVSTSGAPKYPPSA
ncbi:hypothetical protein ACFRCW_40585 [Streptomyces sp. NPDC056653]|uniref:hypothetical protein n=1 Tax=Streptomyces sp. NPDC056653 TaxID=3345894 RepID=UPI0036775CBC